MTERFHEYEVEPDTFRAYAEALVEDQGTVAIFTGYDGSDGAEIRFAVDHRMAQAIVNYIEQYDEACPVELGPWQLL